MKHNYMAATVLGLVLFGTASCSSTSDQARGPSREEVTVTAAAPLTTPLDGIFYDAVCTYQDDSGQTQTVEFHQFEPLDQQSAPQSMLPPGAGANHSFADFFTTVPVPSSCDVTATAGNINQGGDFVPSDECFPAHVTFDVTAGNTTEVVMVVQCKGDTSGAGDSVVVVNEGPSIDSLDLDKFVCVNGTREITAQVSDPDGDQTNCHWQVVSSPSGAVASMSLTDTTNPPGHVSHFTADTIGDYQVQLTCTDVLNGPEATLQFPMHVIDCGCEEGCPDGYELNPSGTGCVRTISIPAMGSQTTYKACPGHQMEVYSNLGAKYPGGTVVTSDAPNDPNDPNDWNDYWGPGGWPSQADPHSRLNSVGVWTCAPDGEVWGNDVEDWLPKKEWIGFSVCLNVPEDGDYLVGLGADNAIRFCVNGTCPFVLDPNNNGNHEPFNYWHMNVLHLQSGPNVVTVEGKNYGSYAAFGAEVSGPFPVGSLDTDAHMMAADFDGHKIFSTGDMIGQPFTYGEQSGYHCPDGYMLNTCGDKPECTLISHIPCGSEVVCCVSKLLPHDVAFLSAEECETIHGHVTAYEKCLNN